MDSREDPRFRFPTLAAAAPLGRSKPAELSVRIAGSREELQKAFALLHRKYVAGGLIQPHAAGFTYPRAFGLPSARTIIAQQSTPASATVNGTLTIIGDHPGGLQIEETFPTEVNTLRDAGRVIAELSGLAFAASAAVTSRDLFLAITRFAVQYAAYHQFHDLLLAVHPRHQRLYKRCFGATTLGPCRAHRMVRNQPAMACRINIQDIAQRVSPAVYRAFAQPEIPPSKFERPPINREDHAYFCACMETSGTTNPAASTNRAA